jgi:NAD(P)-dependent dehydrogenase (short-subunit alcohol dehydrogenase family)
LFHLLEQAASLRGDARIVNHSSLAKEIPGMNCNLDGKFLEPHEAGTLGGDVDVGMMTGPRFHRYQQTKLANVVFTYALDKRLREAGSQVKALCAHPGVAPTELGPSMMNTGISMNPCIGCIFAMFFMQSVEDATMGILRGCCDLSAKSKDFYGPVGKGPMGMKGRADLLPEEPLADADADALLWTASCKATKCSFDICSSIATPSQTNTSKWVGA